MTSLCNFEGNYDTAATTTDKSMSFYWNVINLVKAGIVDREVDISFDYPLYMYINWWSLPKLSI